MKFKSTSTEALNVYAIINQMAKFKPVILEDQYNGRVSYFVPIVRNGRIFIANWNNASFPHDDFVFMLSPKEMERHEILLINQLPIDKLSEHNESIITFISDVASQKLKTSEDRYIKLKGYIRPFPV